MEPAAGLAHSHASMTGASLCREQSPAGADAFWEDSAGVSAADSLLREVACLSAPSNGIPPRPLRLGEHLAHFRLVAKIGEGGMGVVYAARDLRLGRTVALKVVPFAGDRTRRRRFMKEARAAAAVTHPNIATIHEVGEDEGRGFIAMELVRGRTLRALLRAGSPSFAQIDHVARGMARALAKTHEAGIVHRDLKPENVVIGEEGLVKLIDFGLATCERDPTRRHSVRREDTTGLPTSAGGTFAGTPSYMSPEQARGQRVDPRTDVFSFGVVLHEMLTGARPFKGRSTAEILHAVAHDEQEPPSRLRPDTPPELERLVMRCLEKRAAARPASGREILRALDVPALA